MIMLLALPVLLVVTRAHRHLQVYAPSNVLIRQVQMSRPRLRTCGMLVVLSAGLLVAMKVVADAVVTGAPGWLNLVVLVLAWDAVKIMGVAVVVAIRCVMFPKPRLDARGAR